MKRFPWCVALVLAAATAFGAEVDFQRDIRPILSNACFYCHGPDADAREGGSKKSGGLRLDTEEGSRVDLGGSAAVVPGHPEQSDLIKRIITTDEDDRMPPAKAGKSLTPREIDLVKAWVKAGGKYEQHWSYVKPRRAELPRAAANPIDAFILARLEAEGLKPQMEADRAALVRRVSLDLTGLPPSLEEIDAFVNDTNPGAYERLVDHLLASPAYGEHWGRMWLDLARYADSAGYADDPLRTIWLYRDYVIRSFNANKPFDQFTIEQLAGDLLPNPTEEQLTATAFHRNTMTNSEGGTQDEEFRNAAVVDRVNTTMAVWMGTSMACAQCHTHKYDPITITEYFRFFAFLNNTADADRNDESPLLQVLLDEQKTKRAGIEAELAAIETKLKTPTPQLRAGADQWAKEFQLNVSWRNLVPTALKSDAGHALTPQPDGRVQVPTAADKDTYTIEVPITTAQKLTALRLEALPDAALPSNGPGHAGGNFVVTRVRAVVVPATGTPGPRARFVRIELPGKGKLLQLAEVQVFSGGDNVAVKGQATQKSTYADAAATRAIDGNTAGAYDQGSVSHTAENTDDPWWEVDLNSEQPLDRIVVWNRSEVGDRLGGFRIVALDAQRKTVWEQADNAAPAVDVAFPLDGGLQITFDDAVADFVQAGFTEDAVILNDAAKPKEKKKGRGAKAGWAIGGGVGKPHVLTLLAAQAVDMPAGAKLIVRIEQQSEHAKHTLGHFRLSATDEPGVRQLVQTPPEVVAALSVPAGQRSPEQQEKVFDHYLRDIAPEFAADRARMSELQRQNAAIVPVSVPIYRELTGDQRRKTKVQLRGNYLSLGDEVSEGVPAVFPPLPADAPRDRLTLARWLVDAENPLTPRVIANRFWESLFGIGLVRTSEEFGAQGDLPSHPDLLDWLATELVRGKWDVKKFLRLIVTSATYRQSSRVTPELAERDPDNRLLARGPRLRLSAEEVRDVALAVSGLLSRKMHGPSVRPLRPVLGLSAAFGGGLDWKTSTGEDLHRRGLYTEWRRTSPYPSMAAFDAPNRETCTLRRGRTNTPIQALVTMNDPVYVEAAQALARRMIEQAKTPAEQVAHGFRRVLARTPSASELKRLLRLYDEALVEFKADPKRAADMATNPIGPVPTGTDVVELAALTTVASVMLNLDETLMKR